VPYQNLHNQNKDRDAVVPLIVLDRLVAKLEIPLQWEAHQVLIFIDHFNRLSVCGSLFLIIRTAILQPIPPQVKADNPMIE